MPAASKYVDRLLYIFSRGLDMKEIQTAMRVPNSYGLACKGVLSAGKPVNRIPLSIRCSSCVCTSCGTPRRTNAAPTRHPPPLPGGCRSLRRRHHHHRGRLSPDVGRAVLPVAVCCAVAVVLRNVFCSVPCVCIISCGRAYRLAFYVRIYRALLNEHYSTHLVAWVIAVRLR